MPKTKKEKYKHTLKQQEKSLMLKESRIQIWSDGSVTGNGIVDEDTVSCGGCGFVMLYKEHKKEVSIPIVERTTNQRTELLGVIHALRAVKNKRIPIDIFSDSGYVVNCFKDEWYKTWETNGWKNSKKQSVENQDLWKELLAEFRKCDEVVFWKVNGHVGVELNELADKLATQGTETAKQMLCVEDLDE